MTGKRPAARLRQAVRSRRLQPARRAPSCRSSRAGRTRAAVGRGGRGQAGLENRERPEHRLVALVQHRGDRLRGGAHVCKQRTRSPIGGSVQLRIDDVTGQQPNGRGIRLPQNCCSNRRWMGWSHSAMSNSTKASGDRSPLLAAESLMLKPCCWVTCNVLRITRKLRELSVNVRAVGGRRRERDRAAPHLAWMRVRDRARRRVNWPPHRARRPGDRATDQRHGGFRDDQALRRQRQ